MNSFYGINFTYSYNGFFSGGTETSEYYFSSNGDLDSSWTDLDIDVATRNSLLSVGTSGYSFYQYVLRSDDVIKGSSGDDKIIGSKGNDVLNGRGGIDVISFDQFSSSVTVNLKTGLATSDYGTSSLSNFEDVEGSSYADTIIGNAADNVLQGFGGNDSLDGGAGSDTASYLDATYAVTVDLSTHSATGGSGLDTLLSIERIIGSRFNDTLIGSSGRDSFLGGFGNDSLDGGGGVDTAEYSGVGTGVVVDLKLGTTSGGAGNDTLTNIENVNGSIFSDTLLGNSLSNVLYGGDGNDTLVGNEGKDILYGNDDDDLLRGGAGNDVLYGGSGKDIFRFDTDLTKSTTKNIDNIKDFAPSDDTLQLENSIFKIFGKTATGTIKPALFKSNTSGRAEDKNDYLIYEKDSGKLFYDADGNRAGAAIQIASLTPNLSLTYADFVLV